MPLFPVGNEKSKTLGKSNFETAITKCQKAIQLHSIKRRPIVKGNKRKSPKMKAYLSRKEFNPFLKNAWLLMGKAQFQKGDFLEAAATFSYIARQYAAEPLVAAEARIWLARCYTQEDWFYDAEDALKRAGRDSLTARLRREQTVSMANLLLKQGRLEEALPYLRQTARWERRKAQRARLYFLLAQVETSLGHAQAAYKAYGKCLRQSPPYETAFNARIRQTEVMATGRNAQKMLKRLRRMARSANNAEYLDQVYYAIGNIHLAAADTANAVKAYETGRTKAKRAGVEKGVLLLKLGGVYWDLGAYDKAQTCYAEAIGLIDKTYPGYEDITRRSTVLDELVPYTSAVHLQDSLLLLSTMPEAQRNEAIDRVIKDLKHREELERRSKADSIAEARRSEMAGMLVAEMPAATATTIRSSPTVRMRRRGISTTRRWSTKAKWISRSVGDGVRTKTTGAAQTAQFWPRWSRTNMTMPPTIPSATPTLLPRPQIPRQTHRPPTPLPKTHTRVSSI